jgi:hypothetical protein
MLLLALMLSQPAAGFEVRSAGKPPAVVPTPTLAADTVSVRRVGVPRPPWPAGPQLILTSGDRLAATVVGGDGRGVWVQTGYTGGNAGDHLAFPFPAVAAVWLTPPPADTPVDVSRYPWADGPKRTDAVLLTDGDVRRGVVEAFATGGVKLSKAGLLPTRSLAAVAFDPSLSRAKSAAGRRVRATLADGSRLTFSTLTVDGELRGRLVAGPEVTLPTDQLVALDVLGGPAVYLSDLKPSKQVVEGYTGGGWPPAANRSVRGQPLRVGADTFDKGLGTHPRAVLTYTLGGKYRRFEAVVGPDPVSGRHGTAAVRVLIDGKSFPAAGAVSLDVSGAKELTLDVGYGPFGGVGADVNWGDAKLIE